MATTVADILRAESMIASSWPALNLCLSGRWLLGMADGVSGRANSLFFLDHTDTDQYKARLDWMEQTYRRVGLPPRARLSPLAPVPVIQELQARGYRFADPTLTLRRTLDTLPAKNNATTIISSSHVTPEWLNTFIACTPRYSRNRQTIKHMLGAILDQTHYHLALVNGMPVATAMSVQHLDSVTLQNIATLPDFQRRGLATQLLITALHGAAANGAAWCWLAVGQENSGAIALYRHLGFDNFYSYIYATLDQ